MSDNLTVFGVDYTGVAGIKAKGTGNGMLTYIRPTGTKSITANGTGIDVASYSTVDVAVSGGGPNLQAKTNIAPTTSSQTITADSGYDGLSSVQINAMPSGTAGTPTASKGTVSNHSVSVTPSVTNTAGYISGGTKNGTAVTVSASELVSGSETKTANGTYDVTNLASLVVNVSGGGSSSWELIATGSLAVSTTSTSAGSAGTIAVPSSAYQSTDVIWIRIRGRRGKVAGYFYGSDTIMCNVYPKNGAATTFSVPAVQYYSVSSSGTYSVYSGSYGVWGYSLASSGTLTIRRRYNSNNTHTIDDTFDIEVYKLSLPTGKALFE